MFGKKTSNTLVLKSSKDWLLLIILRNNLEADIRSYDI